MDVSDPTTVGTTGAIATIAAALGAILRTLTSGNNQRDEAEATRQERFIEAIEHLEESIEKLTSQQQQHYHDLSTSMVRVLERLAIKNNG